MTPHPQQPEQPPAPTDQARSLPQGDDRALATTLFDETHHYGDLNKYLECAKFLVAAYREKCVADLRSENERLSQRVRDLESAKPNQWLPKSVTVQDIAARAEKAEAELAAAKEDHRILADCYAAAILKLSELGVETVSLENPLKVQLAAAKKALADANAKLAEMTDVAKTYDRLCVEYMATAKAAEDRVRVAAEQHEVVVANFDARLCDAMNAGTELSRQLADARAQLDAIKPALMPDSVPVSYMEMAKRATGAELRARASEEDTARLDWVQKKDALVDSDNSCDGPSEYQVVYLTGNMNDLIAHSFKGATVRSAIDAAMANCAAPKPEDGTGETKIK